MCGSDTAQRSAFTEAQRRPLRVPRQDPSLARACSRVWVCQELGCPSACPEP